MVKEFTHTWTEQGMKDNGKKTDKMAAVLKLGLMEHVTKENTKMEKNMAKDFSLGQMVRNIKESS